MSQRPRLTIPWAEVCAVFLFVVAAALLVGGVYVLAGLGWSMLTAAVPCLVLAALIVRGLRIG